MHFLYFFFNGVSNLNLSHPAALMGSESKLRVLCFKGFVGSVMAEGHTQLMTLLRIFGERKKTEEREKVRTYFLF